MNWERKARAGGGGGYFIWILQIRGRGGCLFEGGGGVEFE